MFFTKKLKNLTKSYLRINANFFFLKWKKRNHVEVRMKNRKIPLFFRHLKLLFWQFFSIKITFSFFEISLKRGGSKHFSTEGFAQKFFNLKNISRISGVLIKFKRILHAESIFKKGIIRVSVPNTFDNRWEHAQIMFQTG